MVNRTDTTLTDAGLTRRKLLALIGGGTAAGFTLGIQPWFRSAFASTEPPGPTIPPPSVPEPALTPLATPTVAETAAGWSGTSTRCSASSPTTSATTRTRGAPRFDRNAVGEGRKLGRSGPAAGSLLTEAQVTCRFAVGELGRAVGDRWRRRGRRRRCRAERKRAANILLAPATRPRGQVTEDGNDRPRSTRSSAPFEIASCSPSTPSRGRWPTPASSSRRTSTSRSSRRGS